MSQNKAIGNSNATDATKAVTGVPEQEEGPQLQFGFFGIPQVTLPQINLRTESGGDLDLTYAISHLLANPAFTTALAESLVPLITPALSASLKLTCRHINRRHICFNIKSISVHPLHWMNVMLDFICMVFAGM